ncbi:rapid alkalinization factor 1 precursor [Zea mays]|jgi:hypothetical protein|uniref:Uncharacterized protein n=1 Tax=Zea mays TaxID=4577 RepID=A0A804QGG7_MAIZE|nr:rapid alkalinization factor 1 precursor [Zea mays]XP_035817377.1 rapid alkalinization factor 1 isoform X1 [Zea mays]
MARLLRAAAGLALLLAVLAPAASAGGDLAQLGAAVETRRGGGRTTCRGGTVGECMEYLDVDAEGEADVAGMATGGGGGKRRVLQGGSGYIGYDALRRDNVPCSQRGASYYNCQPGAEANPYSRGCSAITQCRG